MTNPASPVVAVHSLQERKLRFVDAPDRSVEVIDAVLDRYVEPVDGSALLARGLFFFKTVPMPSDVLQTVSTRPHLWRR